MPRPPTTDRKVAVYVALMLLASFAVLVFVQFAGPDIVGTDGYYHIKVADLMRQQGFPLDFPWLKYTILDQEGYTDHHFLLHVFEVPFTIVFGDLRLAAKWSAVVAGTLAFAAFAWVLLRHNIKAPWLWVIVLFAASSPFLFRMSMARGQSLSLALQFIAFHLIMTRNAKALLILSAVFVWTYNGFLTLIPLVLAGMLAHYVVDRTVEYRLLFAVSAGIAAGLVLHPYFPNDIKFLWHHVVPKLFDAEYATSVGREWYPYNTWEWLTRSWVAVLAFLTALLTAQWSQLKRDQAVLYWLLTGALYFFLFLKSRRFAEYFPAYAVMFLAFASRPWFDQFWQSLRNQEALWARAVSVLIGAGIFTGLYTTMVSVRADIARQPATSAYRGAALWLKENTEPYETVFHSDWDDFPKLFFFNTHNTYLVGLDPDFMRLKDADLFRQWEQVTRGNIFQVSAIIRNFETRYVFSEKYHYKFVENADKDERLHRVFEDEFAVVYRLDAP